MGQELKYTIPLSILCFLIGISISVIKYKKENKKTKEEQERNVSKGSMS